MPKIKALSAELVAKIKAGEVIERPAYALKELIENSIDAGATQIKIELEKSGLQKISITDNGVGMDKDDIRECFKPHTTSKITTEDELFAVQSMGFRGEALASLASVSTMTIRSKPADQAIGTEIHLVNGDIEKLAPFGMPQGTHIIVEELFHNVPARKKFISQSTTEMRLVVEMITALAMAHPSLAISLVHNQKVLLDVPRNQSLGQRVHSLFGTAVFENLIAVQNEESYFKITGFITKPQLSSQNTGKQFLYVNSRKIVDKRISAVIKESYGTLLEPKVHPVFMLFIDIPFERVDVNVHPRKEQVAFLEESVIVDSVKRAIIETLSRDNLIYNDRRWQKGEYTPASYESWSVRDGGTTSYAGQLLKTTVDAWNVQSETLQSSDIIQMHNLYLVTQTKNGIVLIDQHAAHERILFEQFVAEFKQQRSATLPFELASAVCLDLSVIEQQTLHEYREELMKLGFLINEKAGRTHLTTVPELFKDRDSNALIKELLEDLAEHRELKDIDTQSHKMLAYLACRTAIKAGDKLSKEEADNLIRKLGECTSPFTCPHGRPVQIEISLNELHHKFHRR